MQVQLATYQNLTEILKWLEDEFNNDQFSSGFYHHKDMIVESQKEGCLYCVILNNKVIGFVSARVLDERTDDARAYIDLFEIHPDYRKQKIGTHLDVETIKRIFGLGVKIINLQGDYTSKFWMSFGFVIDEKRSQRQNKYLTLTLDQYKTTQ